MECNLRKIANAMEAVPFWKCLTCKVNEIGHDFASVTVDISPDIHLNTIGLVHGGVYATMLDNVMGLAIKTITEAKVLTTNLNINFVANVSSGRLFAKGKINHQGNRTFLVQGEVRDSQDNLLAIATGNFFKIK